ncbi:MAG: tRNA (adenosine(37)-N6)-threonylcarbamoyltransferase complex dimerization subunit type 1 TsaB, partial [Bacteroidia bacterium]|nr:tRNA (adenosine(37)-N6)-threonylcarbamoyltransferase complex dimerization subunit type 1 TsaB [Bacteroidia bacterium]
MIICIETATNLCSVALCDSSGILSVKESNDHRSHASMLTVFIGDLLKENGIDSSALEAVAVSKGPGSYTGLRIGVSVAKGIAFAASIPLIGIETTLSMFMGMRSRIPNTLNSDQPFIFCRMLDARRMEVYYALYESGGEKIKDISAEIIKEDSFSNLPESKKLILFGDGAAKCKNIIKRENVLFVDDFDMSASYM